MAIQWQYYRMLGSSQQLLARVCHVLDLRPGRVLSHAIRETDDIVLFQLRLDQPSVLHNAFVT